MRPTKALSAWILGAVFLVPLANLGRAQTTASISGSVHDSTEALVPGAKIVLINEASKAEWGATSNDEGFLVFPRYRQRPIPCVSAVQVLKPGP